jgi:transcriptional regulator with XRE-family HTH domain
MQTESKQLPANRLKAVLAEKQRSARWLASALGKTESTVSRWCSNRVQPSITQLQTIADLLDVDIHDLLVSTKKP